MDRYAQVSFIFFLFLSYQVIEKLGKFLTTYKHVVGIWTKLSALDPRNVQTRGSPKLDHNPGLLRPPLVQTLQTKTWSHYKNWFAPEYLPGEDEARTIEKRKLEAHLKTEWERYMQVCLWT